MSRSKILLALAFLSLHSAQAQQPASTSPPVPTGSVTGYVVYAESQLPARFAEIRLTPKPADMAFISMVPIKPLPPSNTETPPKKAETRYVVGTTGMDGTFRLDGVPTGDYFVAALKPGYVTPGAAAQIYTSEMQLKGIVASLTEVHIAVGQVTSVNLTLHRGAVISGRLQYADGSPVIGAPVGVQPSVAPQAAMPPIAELRKMKSSPLQNALQSLASSDTTRQDIYTDDEGRYRIFGLSPGKYTVYTAILLDHDSGKVVMEDGSNSYSSRQHMFPEVISVYGPGTFLHKDAKVFEIRGDEQIPDADFTIDPAGLHALKGKVLASGDRHAPSNAMVRLQDGTGELSRFVEIEDDGSYQINYLPPGTYTLQVTAYDSPGLPEERKEPVLYKATKLPAVVGDHDVMLDDILVIPLKPGEPQTDSIF